MIFKDVEYLQKSRIFLRARYHCFKSIDTSVLCVPEGLKYDETKEKYGEMARIYKAICDATTFSSCADKPYMESFVAVLDWLSKNPARDINNLKGVENVLKRYENTEFLEDLIIGVSKRFETRDASL